MANTLLARIGETEAQIEQRYGKPSGLAPEKVRDELGNPMRTYRFHGFDIIVVFVDGKSALEHFVKLYKGGDITYGESIGILEAYGDIWELERDDSPDWHWHSSDRNLKAYRDGSGLGIITVEYFAKRILKMRELAAKRLEGF